jgi:hypothetical protein
VTLRSSYFILFISKGAPWRLYIRGPSSLPQAGKRALGGVSSSAFVFAK